MKILCIISLRNEQRYLPGFLHHIRDRVNGIVALDDCSSDSTIDILRAEPQVFSILRESAACPPHGNESKNRYRLLHKAARLGADWVICADADERYEERFLRRLSDEALLGEQTGHLVRLVKIKNLWNSRRLYRKDGRCGPRWTARMFKIPKQITHRAPSLHQPWFPPELEHSPRAHMKAFLYHLRMIERSDREDRYSKFTAIDPHNLQQAIGYDHLVDESNIKLMPLLPWRGYRDLAEGESLLQTMRVFLAARSISKNMFANSGQHKQLSQADFDEAFYLSNYADVRIAVTNGQFASGWEHFLRYGVREGREPKAPDIMAVEDTVEEIAVEDPAEDQHHAEESAKFEGLDFEKIFTDQRRSNYQS